LRCKKKTPKIFLIISTSFEKTSISTQRLYFFAFLDGAAAFDFPSVVRFLLASSITATNTGNALTADPDNPPLEDDPGVPLPVLFLLAEAALLLETVGEALLAAEAAAEVPSEPVSSTK
jgi:hypothetical protein